MARGPRYHVLFRRRRNGRTNYYKRRRLIVSNRLRICVRTSNKHIRIQMIKAELIGDKILSSTYSSELTRNFKWRGGSRNLSAAYLTGFLAGKKALQNDISEGVLDIGVSKAVHGNRLFAVLKGLVDAGLEISHDESVFPPEERIRGEHVANYANYLEEQGTRKPPQQFNLYKKRGLKPQELPAHFEEVKAVIIQKFE